MNKKTDIERNDYLQFLEEMKLNLEERK